MPRWVGMALSVVVAFVGGFLAITELLLPRVVGRGQEVVVPAAAGVVRDEAVRLLEASQLRGEVLFERADPTVPEGVVLSQEPMAGSVVKVGRRVDLTVSTGPAGAVVPPVPGRSVRQARIDLTADGLVLGDVVRVTARGRAPDEVIASLPPPGSAVERGTVVALLASAGPPDTTYVMPDLEGLPFDPVRRQLTDRGFRVERARYVGGGRGTERVQAQEPAAGAPIQSGARVALTVGDT